MKLILSTIILFASLSAWAVPDFKIHGFVKDAKTSEPIAGVNVVVKGTVAGTITNLKGEYDLVLKGDLPITIGISFIGYRTQEIVIEKEGQVPDVLLTESSFLTEEVVVTASRVEESVMTSPGCCREA